MFSVFTISLAGSGGGPIGSGPVWRLLLQRTCVVCGDTHSVSVLLHGPQSLSDHWLPTGETSSNLPPTTDTVVTTILHCGRKQQATAKGDLIIEREQNSSDWFVVCCNVQWSRCKEDVSFRELNCPVAWLGDRQTGEVRCEEIISSLPLPLLSVPPV